jgi:hypothetical protein
MKELCPNCGADKMINGRFWVCGSLVMGVSGNFSESHQCLRNRLATQTARAIRFMRQVETDGLHWTEVVGEKCAEITRLRGLLGEIREIVHDEELTDDDTVWRVINILSRINEGSE